MPYSSDQRKVIRAIKRIGRKRGESRVKIKAALETGAVESNFRNLPGGDADSAGWRQERASLYKNPTNVKASVNRFYNEADHLYHGQHAGQLAADVQRPAAQYRGRYGQQSAQAKALLRGTVTSPGGGGSSTRRTTTTVPDTAARDATRRAAALAYLNDSTRPDALLNLALAVNSADQTKTNTTVTRTRTRRSSGGGAALYGGKRVGGAEHGSPIPGEAPHAATHDTAGLPGYPAYDYMAKAGTGVVSPVNGTIIRLSGRDPKYGAYEGAGGPLGWSVYIKANNGHTYYLTHMGSRNVKVGEKVRTGQPIGSVANYDKYGRPSHIHMGVH